MIKLAFEAYDAHHAARFDNIQIKGIIYGCPSFVDSATADSLRDSVIK